MIRFHHLLLLFVIILSSCSSKKLTYMNNAENLGNIEIADNYDLKIKPDDQLSIVVNCKEPALAAQFNMMLINQAFNGGQTAIMSGQGGAPQPFIVDSEGCINYPMLGKIKVEGMTRSQVAEMIENELKTNGYIQDPVVVVRVTNFKVSVLGEVSRPGAFDVPSERITIFEALSKAGDLTVYGRRQTAKLLREEKGERKIYIIDLNDGNLLNSPYYYLAQNDVIYIEPNRAKASQSSYSAFWGTIISVLSLATTIGLYFAK